MLIVPKEYKIPQLPSITLHQYNIDSCRLAILKSKVIVPIEKSIFNEIPWARTVHGEAPVSETINKPSPSPNKVRPRHKKNKVENFGFKLSGLIELQETFGTFLIDKNINYLIIFFLLC